MKVYIAGLFEARHRLRAERDWLAKQPGYEIVSTWMDEETTAIVSDPVYKKQLTDYATRDLQELEGADLVILDTCDVDCRGGREIEAGYAFCNGSDVWVVGPPKNIFHLLMPNFAGWGALRQYIAKEQGGLGVLD